MSRKEKFFYFWLGYTACRTWRWIKPPISEGLENAWKSVKEESEKDVPHKFIAREVNPDGSTSEFCCEKPYHDPIHLTRS